MMKPATVSPTVATTVSCDARGGAGPERLRGPDRDQLGRDVAEVTVAPAGVPDRGDGLGVLGGGGAKLGDRHPWEVNNLLGSGPV